MKNSLKRVRRKHLDKKYEVLARPLTQAQDVGGWIRTIREALGMTSAQLAKRVGFDQANVARMEKRELDGTLSLLTLKKLANAMECDLAYVLVPRRPLEEIVRERAKKVAQKELERVSHTMALEAQKTDSKAQKELFDERVEDLVRNSPSKLWEDDQ